MRHSRRQKKTEPDMTDRVLSIAMAVMLSIAGIVFVLFP